MATEPKRRVALVTGSVRGLGLAVARDLVGAGLDVHVVWRSSQAEARSLADEFGPRIHRADLEDPAAADALVRAVLAVDGRLDVLVHAVGEYVSGPLAETGAEDLARMWRSNVETAFHTFAAARAPLRASRGNAVFFGCGGLDGHRARRTTAAYSAAKSALLVLVRSWALEEAAHGVRVNLVSPGHVPHAHAHPDTLNPGEHARIPLGPGAPAEVAEAVRWLVSDAAPRTTGTDLLVSGGWLI